MNCCRLHSHQPAHATRRRWRSAGSSLGSGLLLILLPKCPLCIAAYLSLFTGAGVAMTIAMRLRPLLEILFVAAAALLLLRLLTLRHPETCKEKPQP